MEMNRIRTSQELESVIKVIKANIRDGTIKEVDVVNNPLNEIETNKNWPDLFHNKFQCQTCNQRFILSVETYHGRGGFWDSLN
jgi:hypothetical protein